MNSLTQKSKGQKILWITDPWDTLDHPRDTTLRLIEESLDLGLTETYWANVRDLHLKDERVALPVQKVLSAAHERMEKSFKLGKPELKAPSDFKAIHYRPDPPVDFSYIHPLQLLDLSLHGSRRTEVINPISVLLRANEKTEASLLSDLTPPTVVSSQWEVLMKFGRRNGVTVLKPLYTAQSKGIELLKWKSPRDQSRSKKLLEKATGGFVQPVLLQRYLSGILEGEQRLWFLDGKLLAFARKRPKSGQFKIDMDQGGFLAQTTLSRADRLAATKISRRLKDREIRLAAVDLIESKVTDFNFTSPGLLTQMEALLDEDFAGPVVRKLHGP